MLETLNLNDVNQVVAGLSWAGIDWSPSSSQYYQYRKKLYSILVLRLNHDDHQMKSHPQSGLPSFPSFTAAR